MILQNICDLIIVVGTAYFMIIKVCTSFIKPTSKIKKRQEEKHRQEFDQILSELMPRYLEEHSRKVAQERSEERRQNNKDIIKEIDIKINDIKKININQNEKIDVLEKMIKKINTSSKDIIRQKIMAIYHANKKGRSLTVYDKEALEELYKDYKSLGGNSYIDKYYNRIKEWTIINEYEI